VKISDCTDCDPVICQAHRNHLRRTLGPSLDGLPALYVELNMQLGPGRGGSDDPIVSMTRSPKRIPLAAQVRDAQERILTTVAEAETWARHVLGWMPAPRRGREGPTLQAACDVLAAGLDDWATKPDAPTHAARLLGLGGVGRSALGIVAPRHNRVDLPCPTCAVRSLRRLNGRDDIACMQCGTPVDLDWVEQQLEMTTTPDQREAA
jgi:hypothetical protein